MIPWALAVMVTRTAALRDASRGCSVLALAVEGVYSSDVWIGTHPRERESGHRKAKLI